MMSAKLFIGNLSIDTGSEELSTLFGEVGLVESCVVVTEPESGRSKGYAFVEMSTKESADAAKEKFDGQDLRGRPIKVSDAKPGVGRRNPAGYSGTERP